MAVLSNARVLLQTLLLLYNLSLLTFERQIYLLVISSNFPTYSSNLKCQSRYGNATINEMRENEQLNSQ